jgi:Sulfotransferase family
MEAPMADAIHIDDLTHPRFTPEVAEVRRAMTELAVGCDLDSETLHRQACEETGLSDFGPRDYEPRLEVLLGALAGVENLTPVGRLGYHAQILALLKNRLLLFDLLDRHPEVRAIRLAPPIIIAGLPRSGTTHLHNLLASDGGLRTLPYWESLEPFPSPSEADVVPDPRRTRTDAAVWFMNEAMPLFPLMHEMTTDHAHEEIALLAIDFSTMFFETLGIVPTWTAYYRSHDQTQHYEFLRLVLQALQYLRGGRRWLLKSPQHLEQLPVLANVFPGATIVMTHRDPALVVVSMATMAAYTARMHVDQVDVAEIGRYWADRIESLLLACVRDRDSLAPEQCMDVRFDDLVADDLATARRVYELASEPLTPAAEGAMAAYLAGHTRGRLGSIDYRARDVGLDMDELRERLDFYAKRFL